MMETSESAYDDYSVMEQNGSASDMLESTQETSQPLQSQSLSVVDGHLWGFLQPCSPALCRIDLFKVDPVCTIGRNQAENNIVLPGFKVSEYPVYFFCFYPLATNQLGMLS